jgi:hypothetical protein
MRQSSMKKGLQVSKPFAVDARGSVFGGRADSQAASQAQ